MENKIIDDNAALIDGERQAISGCNNGSCILPCLRRDPRLRFRKHFSTHSAKDCKRQIMLKSVQDCQSDRVERDWKVTSRRAKYTVECDVLTGEFRHVYKDGTIVEMGQI